MLAIFVHLLFYARIFCFTFPASNLSLNPLKKSHYFPLVLRDLNGLHGDPINNSIPTTSNNSTLLTFLFNDASMNPCAILESFRTFDSDNNSALSSAEIQLQLRQRLPHHALSKFSQGRNQSRHANNFDSIVDYFDQNSITFDALSYNQTILPYPQRSSNTAFPAPFRT